MKSKCIIIAVVLVVILGGGLLYLKGKRYDVVITQEQIDQGLVDRFPYVRQYFSIFSLTYSNPQVVLLEESDRVEVGLDVTLNLRINDAPTQLGGGATVTTGIRYDSVGQTFYLDDAQFDRLAVQGVPDQWLEPVADFASKIAKDYIETQPVYRLEAKDAKTAAAKMLLKRFKVQEQALYVTLGI